MIQTTSSEKSVLNTEQCYADIKVLLVDDNRVNQRVGQEVLRKLGAAVDIANNGLEAIQKSRNKSHYDVILMDLQMPKLDGCQATQFIRQHYPHYNNVPIIAMTAETTAADREKCLCAGMNDYIAKPLDIKTLITILDKWLGFTSNAQTMVENHCHLPDFPEQLPGIEIQTGLYRLGGSKILFKRVVCGFYRDHQPLLENLKYAVQQHDWQGVSAYLHQLKGAAGNISALKLAECVKRMETRLTCEGSLTPEQLQPLQQLFLEIGLSVQRLKDWHHMLNAPTLGCVYQALDMTNLQLQLGQLTTLLLNNNLEAEILFNLLYPQLNEVFNQEIISLIQIDIHHLNYEKAKQKIDIYLSPALAEIAQPKKHDSL